MEEDQSLDNDQNPAAAEAADHLSNVDTSRPFRSVKEAVAIFGERFLVPEIYSPKPFSFPKLEIPFFSPKADPEVEPYWKHSSPRPHGQDAALADTIKKLEAELEETKTELKLLKERESETDVALASLNAELHSSMSKLARAEAAAAAAKAEAAAGRVDGDRGGKEAEKRRESLAQVLSVREKESLVVGSQKERKKKVKPIIPLVGDLFSKKKNKGSSSTLHNPLYASSASFHYN